MKEKINHPSTNTLTSSTTTVGTSTILVLKLNLLVKTVTTTSESSSTPEAHLLIKLLKIKTNNKNKNKISTTIIVKSQSTSTKTDNQNGFVLNSSSLNKTQKSQVSDSLETMKTKELTDSRKETQALLTQDLRFTALKNHSAIKSENSLKASVLITLFCKMLQTSVLPMNINSTLNGSRT